MSDWIAGCNPKRHGWRAWSEESTYLTELMEWRTNHLGSFAGRSGYQRHPSCCNQFRFYDLMVILCITLQEVIYMHIRKWNFLLSSVSLLSLLPLSVYAMNYLDPSISTLVIDENHCFKSAPHALMEVHPYKNENGVRVYEIKQIFDKKMQKTLYAKPLPDQIQERQFVARKFCQGFLSLSDMDLPVTKGQGIQDANDGQLLLKETRHRMVELVKHLGNMNNLAIQAATGASGSVDRQLLDDRYQALIKAVSAIAENAKFEDMKLLNGSLAFIKIPIHKGADYKYIKLMNATTGEQGLDLDGTNLVSSSGSSNAIGRLAVILHNSMNHLDTLKKTDAELKVAARLDGSITVVDIRTDQFTTTKKQA